MTQGLPQEHNRLSVPEIRADDLESLNNLLAGLYEAGLPLESGLEAVAGDWPGKAGSVIRQLSERLNQGVSLETALGEFSSSLPVGYVSLVRAGHRTGRLGQILSDLARQARMREETRRVAVVATVYPLFIACFSVFLGLFLLRSTIPMIVEIMIDGDVPPPSILLSLGQFGQWLRQILTPIRMAAGFAMGMALCLLVAWRFGNLAERFAERIPLLGRAWHDIRMAQWAELMAMLLENETPEAEALELSGLAMGDQRLSNRLTALATHLRTGNRPDYNDWRQSGLPSAAIWAMNWSGPLEARVSSLRLMAENYANNARHRMALSFNILPLVMLIGIGGLFTIAYSLLLFLPITSLYRSLA
jgi:general secretion pathway protein F